MPLGLLIDCRWSTYNSTIQYVSACMVSTPCFTVKACDMQDWKWLSIGLLLLGMLVNAEAHDMLTDNLLMFGVPAQRCCRRLCDMSRNGRG